MEKQNAAIHSKNKTKNYYLFPLLNAFSWIKHLSPIRSLRFLFVFTPLLREAPTLILQISSKIESQDTKNVQENIYFEETIGFCALYL